MTSSDEILESLASIPGLAELAAQMSLGGPDSPPHLAAAADFVLEGLYAQKKISRTESGRLYATAPVREEPRRRIEPLVDDDEDEDDTPTGGRKKKYYN
jgi:magnesium chelatase subunit I